MIPAVLGLASGTILLLSRGEDDSPPIVRHPMPERESTPIGGITQKQWMDFLKASTCGKPSTITPSFRLGIFGLTVRRMCDLGAMSEPRLIHYKRRQVWDAHWVDPANLGAFQAAPMLQYRLFCDSIQDYNGADEVRAAIGRIVDGKKITRSGGLMLAHRAGLRGMSSWLTSPAIRERFKDNTTQFFDRANGIF